MNSGIEKNIVSENKLEREDNLDKFGKILVENSDINHIVSKLEEENFFEDFFGLSDYQIIKFLSNIVYIGVSQYDKTIDFIENLRKICIQKQDYIKEFYITLYSNFLTIRQGVIKFGLDYQKDNLFNDYLLYRCLIGEAGKDIENQLNTINKTKFDNINKTCDNPISLNSQIEIESLFSIIFYQIGYFHNADNLIESLKKKESEIYSEDEIDLNNVRFELNKKWYHRKEIIKYVQKDYLELLFSFFSSNKQIDLDKMNFNLKELKDDNEDFLKFLKIRGDYIEKNFIKTKGFGTLDKNTVLTKEDIINSIDGDFENDDFDIKSIISPVNNIISNYGSFQDSICKVTLKMYINLFVQFLFSEKIINKAQYLIYSKNSDLTDGSSEERENLEFLNKINLEEIFKEDDKKNISSPEADYIKYMIDVIGEYNFQSLSSRGIGAMYFLENKKEKFDEKSFFKIISSEIPYMPAGSIENEAFFEFFLENIHCVSFENKKELSQVLFDLYNDSISQIDRFYSGEKPYHTVRTTYICDYLYDLLERQVNEKSSIKEDFEAIDKEKFLLGVSLHDIGKLLIKWEVLKYRNKFDITGYKEEIQKHSEKGSKIIKKLGKFYKLDFSDLDLNYIYNCVKYHHSFYLSQEQKKEVPFYVKILTIGDSMDAIMSRNYNKDNCKVEYALFELIKGAKEYDQFDDNIIKLVFKDLFEGNIDFLRSFLGLYKISNFAYKNFIEEIKKYYYDDILPSVEFKEKILFFVDNKEKEYEKFLKNIKSL